MKRFQLRPEIPMTYRSYLTLFSLLCLTCTSLHAGPNLLTSRWILCDDNSRTRSAGSSVTINAECLYQEVTAKPNDNLDLVCDARGNNFTSAQLSYSNQNFRVLSSALDTTSGNKTLRANAGPAPQNTNIAVATIFANERSTLSCTLAAPDPVQNTTTQAPTPIPAPALANTTTQSVATAPAVTASTCIDSDGDGFGWNGIATCTPNNPQVVAQANTPAPTSILSITSGSAAATAGPCIDSDNDGFGWNGIETCLVDPAQNSQSTASDTGANPTTTTTTSPGGSSTPIQSTTPGISELTDLILVTGQSNAQGAATDVSLAVLDAPNNRVFAFTDEDGWQVADLRQHWDGPNQIRHPGNNALIFANNTPHNNFALHFGKALVALDSRRVVGFVLATAPGAGIRQWRKGSSFYNSLSNKAMTALNASNKTSFDGILWHQGETDFLYEGTADVTATAAERVAPNYYPDQLYTLINNLRQEPWFSTTTPVFICGETQKTSANPAPVNRRLLALNSDSDRHTGCVSSDGLQTTDGIHFDASALREIGKRYANTYIELKR